MKIKNKCLHEIDKQQWNEWEDFDGEMQGEWEYWKESTLEDIDLHRMKCRLCGKIEYYSHAAQQFYENGVDSEIIRFSLAK